MIKNLIRKILNGMGFDVIRISDSPERSFLGLREYPIKTIIDVGANTGQFAKIISNIFPGAHIYAFEPLPEPFKKIKKWADTMDDKVAVFNVALGDKEGDVEMFCHLDHSPSSSLLRTTQICESLYRFTAKQVSISVKCSTLDRIIKDFSQNALMSEILIKLDVQGYEERVIRGGMETFRKAKACILEVNLDKLYQNQSDFKKIVDLLDNLGYRYVGNLTQSYASDGHVVFIDAVFIRECS